MNRSAQSYTDLLYEVVQTADRPLTFQEIVDRIQARRPITTQNPKATVRGAISSARQITSLGDGHYGYLPYLEHGSFLRLPLTEKRPANSRLAYPEDVRLALWPSFFENQKRKNTDPIRATLPDGTETWLPLGSAGNGAWGCTIPEPLRQFMIERRSAAGDALLIRVMGGTTISCEIDIESQRQRDKQAMANRNRELADAVVPIFHERGVAELVGWDLIPLLLARGAYRGDTAPDPFEVALGSDDRFVNGGIAWWLAERMTPSDRAEAKARAQMHDWLFSGGLTGGLTRTARPDR